MNNLMMIIFGNTKKAQISRKEKIDNVYDKEFSKAAKKDYKQAQRFYSNSIMRKIFGPK